MNVDRRFGCSFIRFFASDSKLEVIAKRLTLDYTLDSYRLV